MHSNGYYCSFNNKVIKITNTLPSTILDFFIFPSEIKICYKFKINVVIYFSKSKLFNLIQILIYIYIHINND